MTEELPDEVWLVARLRWRRRSWRVLDRPGDLLWEVGANGPGLIGRLSSYDLTVTGPDGRTIARAQRQPHLMRGWCTFHDGSGARFGSVGRERPGLGCVVTGPGGRRAELPSLDGAAGTPVRVLDESGAMLAALTPPGSARRIAVRFPPEPSWEWRASLLLGLMYQALTEGEDAATRSR